MPIFLHTEGQDFLCKTGKSHLQELVKVMASLTLTVRSRNHDQRYENREYLTHLVKRTKGNFVTLVHENHVDYLIKL